MGLFNRDFVERIFLDWPKFEQAAMDLAKEYLALRGNDDDPVSVISFYNVDEWHTEPVICARIEKGYDDWTELDIPLRWMWEDNWQDEVPSILEAEKSQFQKDIEERNQHWLDNWHTYSKTLQESLKANYGVCPKEEAK